MTTHDIGAPCGQVVAGDDIITDPDESGDVDCPRCAMTLVEFLLARIAEDERTGGPRAEAEAAFKRLMLEGHHEPIHRCAWGDYTFDDNDCRVKAALLPVYETHPDCRVAWTPL